MNLFVYREQLTMLSAHAAILSRINALLEERALVEMGKLEQDLVYGNATSKEVVTFLGYHQNLPPEEKVSLNIDCAFLMVQSYTIGFLGVWQMLHYD